MTLAALFVETGGCYFGLPDVEPWDTRRDARNYPGEYPVVAHPPCERWGRFDSGSPLKKEYPAGEDGGCFEAALRSVEKWGGVLEHPAHSKAWYRFGLPLPPSVGWHEDLISRQWVCCVEQGHYGHVARKPTWLLYRGSGDPPDLIWGPAKQRLPERRLAERGYVSARRCGMVGNQSSRQRQRTPLPFRDLLISIAACVAQRTDRKPHLSSAASRGV